MNSNADIAEKPNFIADEVQVDIQAGRYSRQICTRFPPEPNGYMHLGHAIASSISFNIAKKFAGDFNLRLDDTNPAAEEEQYVNAMIRDVEWLLDQSLQSRVFFASDYFEQLYEYALKLVDDGHAYVDDLSTEEIREYRGDFFTPAKPSPCRDRSVDDNRTLLREMKAGKHPAGSRVLRAKLDLNSDNMNMRDPLIYRILDDVHYRAGRWNIYPMYDFAHPLSDAVEGVTHSLCGKEFENHRPLYDWFLEKLHIPEPPRQIEFAEVGIANTVLSKRYLLELVNSNVVDGWDDPRMPTISALRRLGYPSAAIREFADSLGVSKVTGGFVDRSHLEFFVRKSLQKKAERRMGVTKPVKVIVVNYPKDKVELMQFDNNPSDDNAGKREVPFSSELYIDEDDFMEEPGPKYFRLAPGKQVRLRSAYIVECVAVIKDENTGAISEVHVEYFPDTRSGDPNATKRKVKGTIHWVCAKHSIPIELRMYSALFDPEKLERDKGRSVVHSLSEESLEVLVDARAEPSLASAQAGEVYQFERVGFFCVDPTSSPDHIVMNRTVALRESPAKNKN